MKHLYKSFCIALVTLIASPAFSQTWTEMMEDPDVNFYTLQQEFNQYWANRPIEKGKGWKQFKRYEYFMEPRVYPSGNRTQASRAWEEYQEYISTMPVSTPETANWTPLGPTVPSGGGAGRINFVRFDPNNTSIIYVGSPAGGLWKSTNGGNSWSTGTDALSVIGCTDIAIDPTNTNILYLATGDGDAADTYSIGVLKSTDGGITWNTTGLTWTVNQGRRISRLIIDPSNSSNLIAGTSNGIYRSTDAGATWTQVSTTSGIKDVEFKPGNSSTVYACSDRFLKSTNGGATWTTITSGLPATSAVDRMAIAVTPANAAYVYILAGDQSSSGFYGIYRSTDSGTTFSTRATTPNLMGWSSTGNDSGGQSWYDLAIAASPTNADVVIVGGVNIWRSSNGGTSWTINGHWTGNGAPYVHADIHDLIFLPGSGTTYFSGNDGGVFKTTNSGGAWSDISNNLQIAQMYRLGMSTSNASLVLTGHQDNGTNRLNGTAWSEVIGGDGMECFVDHSNNNVMYGELYYGDFHRSTNGGNSWTNIVSGLTGNSGWVTPWCQDPVTANTLYAGYNQVFKSTNQGTSWSQIGTISGSGNIVALKVAPSNTQVIYAARSTSIYKTTNGGGTWTAITGTLPVASAAITYIEVDPLDENNIWVTFSGYSSSNKVFVSTNGGSSWTNYSTGLPNLPVNCIVYQSNTSDGVYVGTDVGVYYRDASYSSWQPFMTGLPNVIVNELEIYYATGKIRAATFGRGLWESDLFSAGSMAPVANFTANATNICPNMTVQFTDQSSLNPTSWSWSFPGGTPATSTAQNPSVTYASAGTYNVTLTVTNANGNDSEVKSSYITVSGTQTLPLVEGFENATFLPANWVMEDAGMDNITWERNTSVGGFSASAACAYFDNYSNDVSGLRDEMLTPKYDLSSLSTCTLTFDVAYARYNATYSDTLAALISTDCGTTWTQIYMKGGTTLATRPDLTTGAFVPTSTQWRTETINLNTYAGQGNVLVKFQNRGRYGQMLYLDNINIQGTTATLPNAAFTAGATSICAGSTVTFNDQSTGSPTSWSWSFPGGTPSTSTSQNPIITYNTAGTYNVTLTVTNANGSDTQTSSSYITVNSATAPTITQLGNTLTSSTAASYQWYLNGSPIAGATLQTYTATQNGDYTVQITDSNGCTAMSPITTITITGVEEAVAVNNFTVFPNPNKGQFEVSFSLTEKDDYVLELRNALGQLVWKQQLEHFLGEYKKAFDITEYGKGIYTLSLTNSKKESIKKVIVY